MALTNLQPRKKGKKIKPGPVKSKNGVPYDYIVVIDAGSRGSRVFVYNWLNPYHALKKGVDLTHASIHSVRDFSTNSGSTSDSDSDDEDSKSDTPEAPLPTIRYPNVFLGKHWHKKIKPGIATFNSSPQKVGKRHLKKLLQVASGVVPKSQHYRTPIFLHATAGMRSLPPREQFVILDNACRYFQQNSDFYVPDCASHVNVIDGDIEGLYGWLSINSLIKAFDQPESHQHGKNHTTYGLLDMGGASTQVVFQPNASELAEHENNLFKITLHELPNQPGAVPQRQQFDIYLDSFLGFGMFQAHVKYLTSITNAFREKLESKSYYGMFSAPVPDPCLPKGYTLTQEIDGRNVDFTGESNFEQCLESIFPVLANGTYASTKAPGTCKLFDEGEDVVSSCLLNDLIPAFDFDINHFVGVSGYWDALGHLLSYNPHDRGNKRDDTDATYDYKAIYRETSKVCSRSFSELIELNQARPHKSQLKEDELADLCFRSLWILNFLHLGLGFPRFDIDDVKSTEFKSLQLVDQIGGSTFSWTLGRAMLYANDEYIQAYNNYSLEADPSFSLLKRPGYYYTAVASVFHNGAEASGIYPRPQYVEPRSDNKYHHYDYETGYASDDDELRWYIETHRWYGFFTFMFLLAFIGWLMLGGSGRAAVAKRVRTTIDKTVNRLRRWGPRHKYSSLDLDLEGNDLELEDITLQPAKAVDNE